MMIIFANLMETFFFSLLKRVRATKKKFYKNDAENISNPLRVREIENERNVQ